MKRKIILLFLAVFLPLSAFTFILNADEKKSKKQIPLTQVQKNHQNNRSLTQQPIECCYMGMMNLIQTTFSADLGEVTLEVINTSTGEVYYDSFDSGLTPQTLLPISGDSGYYTITYTTESGDIYEGILTLN